jgi:hypothetical protein
MIKSTTNHRQPIVAALVFAGVLVTGNANALESNFSGSISEKLKVSGCGKDTGFTFASTNFMAGKKWITAINEGTLAGTYKKRGQRTLRLKLNSNSKTLLMNIMRNWASDLCGTAVKNLRKFKTSVKLKLNKKGTALSGNVKATATGETKYGSGKGQYSGKVRMKAI